MIICAVWCSQAKAKCDYTAVCPRDMHHAFACVHS